jgi:hypothetical protein
MNFLPLEDIKVVWLLWERGAPREGHAWYDGQYCRFQLDCSSTGCDARGACLVYLLYAMTGETLVAELARRKLFELADDGAIDADLVSPIRDGSHRRAEDQQFIGRFIALYSNAGRSNAIDSDHGVVDTSTRTWLAPVARTLGEMLHTPRAGRRAG